MSETRIVLPHLEKIGQTSPSSGETRETAHHVGLSSVGRVRNANVNNKRVKTGLASGLHESHPPGYRQSLAADIQLSNLSHHGLALDPRIGAMTPAPANSTIHMHDKSICLPVIETPGTEAQMGHQWQGSGLPFPSPTDAAYIRSRSVTPSPLGAHRDAMPRSKKTALFAGYLPDLPAKDTAGQEFSLTVEGHHDLQMPPRKTPTEPRKVEKSQHKISSVIPALDIIDDYDTLEEGLKTLLLCRAMGVGLQVSDRPGDYSIDGSVRTIFHCPRCLKHWSEHGTTPDDCKESEKPTLGPVFVLSLRHQEILREFESLSLEDMHKVVNAIKSRGSANLSVDSCLSVTSPRRAKFEGEATCTTIQAGEKEYIAQFDKSHQDTKQYNPQRVNVHPKEREHESIRDLNQSREEHVSVDSGKTQAYERVSTNDQIHKVDDKDTTPTEPANDERIGQYGPDGSFYPGHYGPDGRFVPTSCTAPNGQQYPVVMGPDGRFYVNASYGSDGRFILGPGEADKQSVTFLTASEMAALKTAQKSTQGVVGPDGLFYPKGFYQADGSFAPGGPPHTGHPSVWGPTLGQGSGYKLPPTDFGPAWPLGAPVPYSREDIGLTFLQKEDRREHPRIHEDFNQSEDQSSPETSTEITSNHQKDSQNITDRVLYNSDVSGVEMDRAQQRDLFSPWGKEDELQNLQTSARKSEHMNNNVYAMNVDITVSREQDQNQEVDRKQWKDESADFDDLDKDMSLSRLDSKMRHIENDDDETGMTPDELAHINTSQGVATNQDDGKTSTNDVKQDQSDEFTDIDLQAKASVLNEKLNDVKDAAAVGSVSNGTYRGQKRRESTASAAYMGVMDKPDSSGSESLFKTESSGSQDVIEKARRGSIAPVSERRGSKAVPIKPGKNLAVKNVTGKPERKPGLLERHMFATPHADLAKTNVMGVSGKRDSLRGSHGLLNSPSTDKNNKTIKEDTMISKPKLPSIGGGEPTRDRPSSRSPSPIKQTISPIGSGETRSEAAGGAAVSKEDAAASEPDKRGTKVTKKKGKETRKTITRKKYSDSIDDPIDSVSNANIKATEDRPKSTAVENRPKNTATENRPTSTTLSKQREDSVFGTYHDIIRSAENAKSSRDEIATSPTKSSSILDKFSQFQLSMPPDSTPQKNKDQGASYRMTYSTLPSFGARAPQSTAPLVDDMSGDARKKTELKPVKSKSIPFDFEHVERGYDNRARKSSSSRTIKSKKSSSKNRTWQRSTSSASSRASSAASSVWESVSDIWKKHKSEMDNLQKCVENSYLPLTNAFTFSFFPIAPAHATHNRVIYEKAAAIKQLRKPIKFKKPRGGIRSRKVVPLKTVAPVK